MAGAVEGECDPNLALVDVFRQDYGDQVVADALARMEEDKNRNRKRRLILVSFTKVRRKKVPYDNCPDCSYSQAYPRPCHSTTDHDQPRSICRANSGLDQRRMD